MNVDDVQAVVSGAIGGETVGQTVEGLAHATRPLFSVQYHPEASPGPHDADYFFDRFREMVDRCVAGEKVSGAAICGLAPKAVPTQLSAE